MSELKTLAVLGCGARGRLYAEVAAAAPEKFRLVAACDPVAARAARVGAMSANPTFREFSDEADFFAAGRLADALVVATQDHQHHAHMRHALDLGYDILLEKSIAATLDDVLDIEARVARTRSRVMVCHVLRHAPFFTAMRDILASGEIGELVNFEASEGVEPWHMAHSFVRGHWSKPQETLPMLVIKSCHDMDLLSWLVGRPCEAVSAFGALAVFASKNAPAGSPARCTDGCPAGDTCFYNAEKYAGPEGRHRLGMVYDDPDASPEKVRAWLRRSPWGRCVYRCDNTAQDHIGVGLRFEGGVTGTFTLTAFDSGRHYAFYGTKGVLRGGPSYRTFSGADILVQPHGGGEPRRMRIDVPGGGHGGNAPLVHAFHAELCGRGDGRTRLDASVHSHVMAFAAERSRATGKTVEIRGNRF